MRYKKIMILAIFLVSLLAVSAVSAADNATSDIVSVESQEDTVITGVNDDLASDADDNILSTNPKTFTDLNALINDNENRDVYLDSDYKYNPDSDSDFEWGIGVYRDVTVHGNGFTIDGANTAIIFSADSVYDDNVYDIVFRDIVFVNGQGGAIYLGPGLDCTAVNCTFKNNHAGWGGAMNGGSAVGCTFIGNSAGESGGAMSDGSAVNCTFINNTAEYGGAMCDGSALNCIFIGNSAGESGGAMSDGSAVNCTFINNVAIWLAGAMCGGSAVDCTFINNTAEDGGAMFDGSAVNCIFINNTAEKGGAMSEGVADNCTFSYNSATARGGAVYCSFVSYSSKFNDNTAPDGNDTYDVNWFEKGEEKSFAELETLIEESGSDVYLDDDYAFDPLSDIITGGIGIGHAVTIHGNGHTINAINVNRIFRVYVLDEDNNDVVFKDIVFVNGNSVGGFGGAIYIGSGDCSAVNCTFINNTAENGGAMYGGSAVNCTFVNNSAVYPEMDFGYGGAMFGGSAVNCTFVGNSAEAAGGAMYGGSAENCIFKGNTAPEGKDTYYTELIKSNMIISAVYDAANKEIVAVLTNNATGKTIANANVNVDLNGVTSTVKSNSKGKVTVSVADLPLGTYTATISYAGNSKYNAASTSINVEVKTKVIVTDVYAYSDRIVAKLTNGATGKTIANANMIVEINGVKYNAKSDNKGQLTFNTKGLNLPSSYDLTISYRGNDRYTASSATVAVDLNKANMMITTNYHADKQKMVATLKNSKTGVVVRNANMIIDLNGVKTTYKSNDQGKITLPTADFAPGTYVGTVTYPGNARYNSISAVFKVDV